VGETPPWAGRNPCAPSRCPSKREELQGWTLPRPKAGRWRGQVTTSPLQHPSGRAALWNEAGGAGTAPLGGMDLPHHPAGGCAWSWAQQTAPGVLPCQDRETDPATWTRSSCHAGNRPPGRGCWEVGARETHPGAAKHPAVLAFGTVALSVSVFRRLAAIKPLLSRSPRDSSRAGGESGDVLVLESLLDTEEAPTGAARRPAETRGGRRDPGDFPLFFSLIESKTTLQEKLRNIPESRQTTNKRGKLIGRFCSLIFLFFPFLLPPRFFMLSFFPPFLFSILCYHPSHLPASGSHREAEHSICGYLLPHQPEDKEKYSSTLNAG